MQGVWAELRSVVGGLAKPTDWRRVSLGALPVAATFFAGSGALYIRKVSNPPDGNLLQQRCAFRCIACNPDKDSASLPPQGQVLDGLLNRAGLENVDVLRCAAQQLRTSAEGDIMAVESLITTREQEFASLTLGAKTETSISRVGEWARPFVLEAQSTSELRTALYKGLVARWHASGSLDEQKQSQKRERVLQPDVITQQNPLYGRDMGCEMPLCLLQPDNAACADINTLSVSDWQSAATSLAEHGVVLMQGLLQPSQVCGLRESLHVHTSSMDRKRAEPSGIIPVREYDIDALLEKDPGLEAVTSTPGRQHINLRGSPFEDIVRQVQAGAVPLIWEHLSRTGLSSGSQQESRPYISEIQLLVSEPCAVDQFWHLDNTTPGLTLFVPLTSVPEDMGPTILLPGSYHLFQSERSLYRKIQSFASSFFASEGLVVGSMSAGDALLYDSRIIHRGAMNRRYDRTRIALVFRYDVEPPPGVGALGTLFVCELGKVLSLLLRFYATLPTLGNNQQKDC